ncbi:hypothetical protein FQN50_000381 [Emmonsiellopsis sp. PD_5]|nr:hypothetical protein FQN50_000381 [Emmonsiellopsis sp. PD_5]
MGIPAVPLVGEFIEYGDIYKMVYKHVTDEFFPRESGYHTSYDQEKDKDLPPIVIKFRDHDLLWIHCGGFRHLDGIFYESATANNPFPSFGIAVYLDRFECFLVGPKVEMRGRVYLDLGPFGDPSSDGRVEIILHEADRSTQQKAVLKAFIALIEEEKKKLETANTA